MRFCTKVRDVAFRHDAEALLTRLGIVFEPFGVEQARVCAALHVKVQGMDVSFADRACLSLGLITGRTILSADTDWAKFDLAALLDVAIRLIR